MDHYPAATRHLQVEAAVRATEEVLGPVDLLVCNAGVAVPGYFHEQPLDVFESTMRLNYFGALHSVRAVYPGMVARNAGHICFITSTMAQMGASRRARAHQPSVRVPVVAIGGRRQGGRRQAGDVFQETARASS